jgi:hypothetical protein
MIGLCKACSPTSVDPRGLEIKNLSNFLSSGLTELQVVNCAQLISRESSTKTGSNITSTFKDSRLMDAVLVLEDFQVFSTIAIYHLKCCF